MLNQDNIMTSGLEEPETLKCRGCKGLGYNPLKTGAKVECVVCRGKGEVPYEYVKMERKYDQNINVW